MTRQDFDGAPFVAGSITGLRAFHVDSLGRLSGPSYGAVFGPGENIAQHMSLQDDYTFPFQGDTPEKVKPAKHLGGAHKVAEIGCHCGYYAYFDGSNTYASSSRYTAVIEGYGRVTVGSRGFRSEKARLLAIVAPRGTVIERFDRTFGSAYGFFYKHGSWVVGAAIGSGIVALMGVVSLAAAVSAWWLLGLTVPVASVLALVMAFRSIPHHFNRLDDASRASSRRALVRRNYPDVPIFSSQRRALKAFPLTTPPAPVEPTPSDDDFWTRSAS